MSNTYCSLPWIHLASHPAGGVTLCCISDHSASKNRARNFLKDSAQYLELNTDSIESIMNSDYFKEVRLQMLNDEVPVACKRCFEEEAYKVKSKRIVENETFKFTEEMARAITQPDGTIPVNFKFVELRLGNLCNVKCRTCNPASSTNWSIEYQQLQQAVKFVTKYDKNIDASWTESDAFWNDLLTHCKDLELIYINGGEPTLVEKHWKFLERLIELGLHKQITLWYSINMTNLPDKLLALWSQFKAVRVTCSVDDLYERNEYLRTGTKWTEVIANLDKLQALPWINVSICQTVGWMNVLYVDEFTAYMNARGLIVYMNFVYDPEFLSIKAIPNNLKHIVEKYCSTLGKWEINSIVGKITDSDDLMLITKGIEYNTWLDKSRKTSLYNTFPRLLELNLPK